jgi:hypothetical protein
MRFYLKKEVKQLLEENSEGKIKSLKKDVFHLAKGTPSALYQIKGITSSDEPNILHISEDVNVLNKRSGKIIHHHKDYKLKKSGIKNLLKESPLKLIDKKKKDVEGIIRSYISPITSNKSNETSSRPTIFRKFHIPVESKIKKVGIIRSYVTTDSSGSTYDQALLGPAETPSPMSVIIKKDTKKDKDGKKKTKSETLEKLSNSNDIKKDTKKDKDSKKKIKSHIKKEKKKDKENKKDKEVEQKMKSKITKDKKKKGEKKVKSEIKKLKKINKENK